MVQRRQRPICTSSTEMSVTELWLLRMLVPLGGHKNLINRSGFRDDDVARAAGLSAWLDDNDRDFDSGQIRAELKELHHAAEQRHSALKTPATLTANVQRLAAMVGLSDVDCRILEFAVMIQTERVLDDAADTLGTLSSLKVLDALARILDIELAAVRSALSAQGLLAKSGLLALEPGGGGYLRQQIDLLSSNFASQILASDAHPLHLLSDTISLSRPARLTLDDFGHISEALALLRPYLARALAGDCDGVNIFVYGPPGTGKSELARALAADQSCELFEVAGEDSDGDPVDGERRLRAYRAAQSFFGRRNALILFDEVEDVFNDGNNLFGRKSTAQRRKAWLNRTLEQNKVPALWLSNSITDIDPAFMRRFDMVIELPVPPQAQRERIVRQACGDLLDERATRRLAQAQNLSPAVVSRMASVVRSINGPLDQTGSTKAVQWLIDQSLQAQGLATLRGNEASHLPPEYDAALLNADTDMLQLADGLAKTRSGRLCLYGPPGTGKTAYGRWLAERLGMPLLLYSASELISKWVGDSEKNIAAAFKAAQRESAVLLIDEVDSFLQDRTQAHRSWEVTMVNEMLTRMESYSGVFIASTNLMAGLDPAALRRFDLKVHFNFLLPDQSAALLARYCASLALAAPAADAIAQLRHLRSVTPGDFSAVARQHRFRPIAGATAFVQALAQECKLKEKTTAPIGFLT